ncbi:MAG: SURF1 family protein [Bauldia sp.]|nr:SURF1 family protein [Bauldia sp.]
MAGATAPKKRRLAPLLISATIAFVILCVLGTWQVQRLVWKNDLIATVETRIGLVPVQAPAPAAWPALDFDEADYTPVAVSGTFRHDQEVHVFASLDDPHGPVGGFGYFVLTPLETADGWTVIVNRGFVPTDRADPATRPEGQTPGVVTVTGLLRQPQGSNAFTPANDVEGNVWYTRDPVAIGAELGLPAETLAPYYIDAAYDPSLPGGLPQGGETTVSFINNHLQYAVTWYGIAIALVVIVVVMIRRKPTPPLDEPPADT